MDKTLLLQLEKYSKSYKLPRKTKKYIKNKGLFGMFLLFRLQKIFKKPLEIKSGFRSVAIQQSLSEKKRCNICNTK